MQIKSATFVKGIVDAREAFADNMPQVALIGRSNVGKSSTINALTKQKGLAKTSSFPGRTQQINLFLINNAWYLVDLPGYGYAKASAKDRVALEALIKQYLFNPDYSHEKVVLIIDGEIGPTSSDLEILDALESSGKPIIIAVNKFDKVKPSKRDSQIKLIQSKVGPHTIVHYSAEKGIGIGELMDTIAPQ